MRSRPAPDDHRRSHVVTDTRHAIAWRRAQDALQCDEVTPWAHGSVLRTPSVPDFWDANAVRVEDVDVAAETMYAAGEEFLADCAHRKLDVVDEATGAAARPFFAARGWLNERHAVMRRVGPPPPRPEHDVVEVPLAGTRALRAQWYGEHGEDDAFAAAQEPILARRGARGFVVGEVGFTVLCVGPGAVEIDGVYVQPTARGQGFGTALIAGALRASGADVAWIVADDEGRARPLYDRLGFETVWRPYCFVKVPSR
jgi:ribosomal protein S18 acetylase RimI-like enzyme